MTGLSGLVSIPLRGKGRQAQGVPENKSQKTREIFRMGIRNSVVPRKQGQERDVLKRRTFLK